MISKRRLLSSSSDWRINLERRDRQHLTKALERLDNASQQLVKAAVFDFQMNPANPGFQLHRLDRPKDPNFWSFRVNQDVRGIVHQADETLVIEKIPNASDPPGQGVTWSQLHRRLASEIGSDEPLYKHAVVDEAQDFGPSELQLLRALVAEGPDDLFFAGDIGQRIYRAPFRWQSVGIDVRGRSTKLAVNYRTTQQIRQFADRLMPEGVGGLGNDGARASVALLAGDEPAVHAFESNEAEVQGISKILQELVDDVVEPQSIAVVRRALNPSCLREAAEAAVEAAGLAHWPLAKSDRPPEPSVLIGTMHRVKGLEFDAMIVMGCDRDTIPYRRLLDENSDPADRETFIEQERNLLYVACTRARRSLFLTHVGHRSELLSGLGE